MEERGHEDAVRRRYDRVAPIYDWLERPMERRRFSAWRSRFQRRVLGPRALEVGVGTGKNMPYYPPGLDVTAIDISPRMLARARLRASRLGLVVDLREMDVQRLEFPNDSFDGVFAAFVFCSAPDPVTGLAELRRVCRSGGRMVLLEHVRPSSPVLARMFDAFNPIVLHVVGANINRRTVDNVRRAGWTVQVEENLSGDVVKWIEAVA